MKRTLSIIITALVFITLSCQKEEPAELNLITKTLSFDVGESEQSISFSCNYPWIAETAENWLFIKNSSGEAGNVVLTVKCYKNTNGESRSGVITIHCEELTSTVSVTQEAIVLKRVKEEDSVMEVGWQSQEIAIDVQSNTKYNCTIKGNWVEEVSTKAPTITTHVFRIAENTKNAERSTSIIFSQGSISFAIEINQEAKPVMELTPSSLTFKPFSSSAQVKVKSSGVPEVRIPEDAPWLSVTADADTYTFSAEENEIPEPRNTEVVFELNGLERTLSVSQEGASNEPFLDINSGTEYTVSSNGGGISVDIRSNLDIEMVSELPEWLSVQSFERSGNKYMLELNVANYDPAGCENFLDSFSKRKATITLSDNNGHETEMTVTQNPVPFSSIKYQFHSQYGGDYSIGIKGSYNGYASKGGGTTLLDNKPELEYTLEPGDYFLIKLVVRDAPEITIPAVHAGDLDLRELFNYFD